MKKGILMKFEIGDMVEPKYIKAIKMYGFITKITKFNDRTYYSVVWFEHGDEAYDEYEVYDLKKVS